MYRTIMSLGERCKTDNILCVHDVGQDFITTDYLDSYVNLESFLQSNPRLSPPQILQIITNLMSSVNALHKELKMVHHDLKPANIMIHPQTLNTVIIDFGVSCMLDGDQFNCQNAEKATPLYAFPETTSGAMPRLTLSTKTMTFSPSVSSSSNSFTDEKCLMSP
jgi:serine/threonine protein kinase